MDGNTNRLLSRLPVILICLLTISNIALIAQNLHLRGLLNNGRPGAPRPLNVKESVAGFSGKALDGSDVEVSYGSQKARRIFFYFSPDCAYCDEQFPLWKQLMSEVDHSRYEMIGLVSDWQENNTVQQYLQQRGCENLKVLKVPSAVLKTYRLSLTPMTLVVDGAGTVEGIWPGRWDERMINDVRVFFSVTLNRSGSNRSATAKE
jgi:hypothetical protein